MIRRILFGLLWFVVFWIGTLTLGGGIAGAIAGGQSSDDAQTFGQGFDHGYQAGVVAGMRFRRQFGPWILAGAATLAVAGTAAGFLPGTKK
ncbi:MAG: hypothetical protein WCF18_14400 [Chthoniobacteraceae bacterium]